MGNNQQLHRPSEDNHGTPPQGDDSETLVIPKPVTSCNCIEKVTINTSLGVETTTNFELFKADLNLLFTAFRKLA